MGLWNKAAYGTAVLAQLTFYSPAAPLALPNYLSGYYKLKSISTQLFMPVLQASFARVQSKIHGKIQATLQREHITRQTRSLTLVLTASANKPQSFFYQPPKITMLYHKRCVTAITGYRMRRNLTFSSLPAPSRVRI